MRSMFIPTPGFLAALRGVLVGVPDYTDAICTVRLVEGEFDPADPATWPSPSAHFLGVDSDDVPTIEYDAVSEAWYIVWPDPVAGWDFVAATITSDITVTGYIVGSTEQLGATKIEAVTVTANGQHVVLPFVVLEVSPSLLVPADQPVIL